MDLSWWFMAIAKNLMVSVACISRDEGKTWDVENEIILTGAMSRDLGYPSSVQLDDESILTVYYQAQKIGDPACLMSTHWRLK